MAIRRLVLILLCSALPQGALAQGTPARPNVVLIMTDDMGYGDLGSYGVPDARTPSLDRLAREGVRLTDFYANGSTCTPTRAGLVTGRYQQRVELERPLGTGAEIGLVAEGRSLPQLLKKNGYATALVGKWHLGYRPEHSPNAHGFDYFWGIKGGYVDYYQHTGGDGEHDLFENEKPVETKGYLTDLITERSVRFIEGHARQPFFLEVAYTAPHWPYQVPGRESTAPDNARHVQPHEDGTSTRADYVAMVERMDAGVGQILQTLDRLRLSQQTLVIFTNDNGGEWLSRNDPLFNRKWSLWEGGIRVPAIFRWPGQLPAGRVSPQVGITMDLTATVLAATGTPAPDTRQLEGINLLPSLTGKSPLIERTLFWRVMLANRRQWAVRSGDWKLVIDADAAMVFNLKSDPGERSDMARTRQDVVNRLRPLLDAWQNEVDNEARSGVR